MREIDNLLQLMSRLRDPHGGCPWDLEQGYDTIVAHTIEEAYEVADAIARGDRASLKDELGDLLFQVVFYAQLAREEGIFDFAEVAAAITDKMIRRHPHVFGDANYQNAAEQTAAWERIKAAERGQAAASALDGVTLGLPALTRAVKLQRKAAQVGFDWSELRPVLAKIREELEELEQELDAGAEQGAVEDELGDVLFACANLARHMNVDPETALRGTNRKFERRFRRVESWLSDQGRVPAQSTLEEMDALWERAKQEERDG